MGLWFEALHLLMPSWITV